ncbi:hypothetical protein NUW54_g5591 [Trametes sanguinea]|uniref:Uncharacterized protein n=1 Tax=Trametes sanguinea TaxID=158606 RepID=A0ACC1PWI8_9APHY|nr:hypothetical protein NUW54_g5591 [Trametes sanguinea]
MYGDIEDLVLSGKLFNPPSRSNSPVRSRSPSPSRAPWINEDEDFEYDSDAERRAEIEAHIASQQQQESIGMGPGRTGVKGVKVYIKRGERDFCEGILGNVKLLRHKDTRQERILFRREPVMKVSMNVRLQPLVRCTFDEAQGLLRVTLKEPIEGSQQDQVVVYAMKRGQASKADFADFSQSVLESSRLCMQAPA